MSKLPALLISMYINIVCKIFSMFKASKYEELRKHGRFDCLVIKPLVLKVKTLNNRSKSHFSTFSQGHFAYRVCQGLS